MDDRLVGTQAAPRRGGHFQVRQAPRWRMDANDLATVKHGRRDLHTLDLGGRVWFDLGVRPGLTLECVGCSRTAGVVKQQALAAAGNDVGLLVAQEQLVQGLVFFPFADLLASRTVHRGQHRGIFVVQVIPLGIGHTGQKTTLGIGVLHRRDHQWLRRPVHQLLLVFGHLGGERSRQLGVRRTGEQHSQAQHGGAGQRTDAKGWNAAHGVSLGVVG